MGEEAEEAGGENIVEKTTKKVAEKGKGFLASIVSAPFDLVKGAFSGLFNGITGLGKGILRNTIGNPFGLLTTGGVLFGLEHFAPQVIKWASDKIGKVGKDGKTIAEIYVEDKKEGTGKTVMDLGLAAAVINATMGAVGGTFSGVADSSSGSDRSTAQKVGGFVGSGALLAGIGLLAFNKISSTKIGATDVASNGNLTPPTTPPKPGETKAQAQPTV